MGGRRRKNLFKSASEQRTREFRKKSPNDTPINFFDNWMMELHTGLSQGLFPKAGIIEAHWLKIVNNVSLKCLIKENITLL